MPPIRYDIEPGGEYLLPYAKKKLAELRKQAKNQGLRLLQRRIMVDSGSSISLSTQASFGDTTNDSIRVTGGGWVAEETTSGVTAPQVYFLRSATKVTTEANDRNLNPGDYYFKGVRYRIDIISAPIAGIPDPDPVSGIPLVYPLLAIYNVTSGKYAKWVAFSLTGSNGAGYRVQYTDFSFVSDTNLWAVAYLRAPTGNPWIRRIVYLDIFGATFGIDFPAMGFSTPVNSVIFPSFIPVGVLAGIPYFFVDGRSVTGAYTAKLVSAAGNIDVLTLDLSDPLNTYNLSWFSGRDCGGVVTRPDGSQAIEIIFQLGTNDLSTGNVNFALPMKSVTYGYSTDSYKTEAKLKQLDTATYSGFSGGKIVYIPPNYASPFFGFAPSSASRTAVPSVPTRKTNSCIAFGRVYAPIYIFNGTGNDLTIGDAQYGSISLDGYSLVKASTDPYSGVSSDSLTQAYREPLIDPTSNALYFGGAVATFITNSFRGFVFPTITGLRFVSHAGSLLLNAPLSPSPSSLGSSAGLVTGSASKRFILPEKNDVVVFTEIVHTLSTFDAGGNPTTPIQVVERWMFRLAKPSAVLLSTYQFTSNSPSFRGALLDGLSINGKAYAYVLAEDTPNTAKKSALRLITNNPGSISPALPMTYLALMDSSGKIGAPIQSGVSSTFTLNATEPTLKATALQFAAWNK